MLRTIKPFQLSLMFRTVERSGQIFACFTLFTMDALTGAPLLRSEPSIWKTLAAHAPEFSEAGVLKSQSEFLLFGHAHAPAGASESIAGVRFGAIKKWCRVFGERAYPRALPPQPFGLVRLDWRNAYGGPDAPANPLGTGRQAGADGQIRLPPLEHPETPWRPGDQKQVPFGFGPLDVMHPQRRALAGTYGEDYLRTDFPGLASDADWHFFQVAPPDQRFAEALIGDESFDLIGMHPGGETLHGQLDGTRPRLFIQRRQQPGLREIDCRLRTVVLLPDALSVVQIWQGALKVSDEDAFEISHAIGAIEHLFAPKPPEHYANVFAKRLDEEDGLLAMLRDEDLLPEGMSFEGLIPGDLDLNKPAAPDSLQGRLEKKNVRQIEAVRAEVASHGMDPDVHAPPLPAPREAIPPPHQLGEYLRELDLKAQQHVRAAEESKSKLLEDTAAEFAARGESFDYVLKEMSTTPTGPPKPATSERMGDLRKIQAQLAQNNTTVAEIDEMLADTQLHARWHAADASAQTVYEQSAHFQNPAPRTSGRTAKRQRGWAVRCLASGQPLRGYDLTGADLRGLDLRGADLDGALLEAACLDGVDLSGASAKGTVFAHASFVNARADGCDFSAANLGKASFASGSACAAVFTHAILWRTDFTRAVLRGARFADADVLGIKLAGADLSEAVLDELLLYQTDLTDVRLNGASLNGTQFIDNRMVATNFAGAHGRRAVFLKMHGEGLSFDGADLSGAMFVQEPKLPRASMRGTRLTKAFAHGIDLSGADLSHADLDGSELGRSNLRGANLRGATARDAGLRFVDLSQAQAVGADLRGALLASAKLCGARFDASSFFMADVSRVEVDSQTSLSHVNFGRTRTDPKWKAPAR